MAVKGGQDRGQGGAARSLRHVPACRGCGATAVVRGNSATDRLPPAEASTDMTPRVIAAIRLNRRAPESRRLPSDDNLASACAFAGSEWHRVPDRRSPIRVEWSTFRSIRDRVTVFAAWAESTGKSRINIEQMPVTPISGN